MKSKILYLSIIILIIATIINGCSPNKANLSELEKEEEISRIIDNKELNINVAALNGPTTIGMVELIDKYEKLGFDMDKKFHMYNSSEELVASFSKKEIDVAAIPANLASNLYNKMDGEIKVAAINTLGVLYIVENGNTIQTPKDLENKTIYSIGKGTTPEGVLKVFIEKNDIKNLNIEFKSEASEIGSILNSEENAIAMLPEPFVTSVSMKNENIRTVFNMNKEWMDINNGSLLVTGVLVVRNEFLEENKTIFNEFLNSYEKSIKYTMTNVKETAELSEKIGIIPAEVGLEAIPKINIVYIDGDDMVKYLDDYLTKLYEFNENLVGGKVPDENFYYKE